LALLLYPTEFRRRYAAEMEQVFVESLDTFTSRRRLLGPPYVWANILWDTVIRATTERVFVIRRKLGLGAAGKPPHKRGTGLDAFLKDLRYAVRTLRKSPAFTAVVVLSLALGIGATSTIFSAVNPILLRPLPFADPDRLVYVSENSAERPNARRIPTAVTSLEWTEHNEAFEQIEWVIGATRVHTYTYPGDVGPERYEVQWVSSGLFHMLGVEPMLGRNFVAEDNEYANGSWGVILSYGFWQQRFGGDPDILGQTWGNQVVIGVMSPGFRIFPWNEANFWEPLGDIASVAENPNAVRWYEPIGRLKRGVSKEGAQAQLDALARGLDRSGVSAESGWRVRVEPLHEFASRSYASNLYLLLGAAVLLLLIACSNVASLLMGRATTRHHEITTRAALGAGRLRLMRQLLTESVVLALSGGVLGVLLAQVGTRLFVILAPRMVPARRRDPRRRHGSRVHAGTLAADRDSLRDGPGAPRLQPRSSRIPQARGEGLGWGIAPVRP